jgi:hypothetical protein
MPHMKASNVTEQRARAANLSTTEKVVRNQFVSAWVRRSSHRFRRRQNERRRDVFIGDEGRSFGFGDQVADPKPPRAVFVKSHGGERCGNVGTMIPASKIWCTDLGAIQ